MPLLCPDVADDVAPFEYRLYLPHDPRAVAVARASLRAALAAHGVAELTDRAELLASELLTNALVHARGEAELRVTWAPGTLRLSVWDMSPKPPAYRDVNADSERGRGLRLMLAMADRWDHYPVHSGRFQAPAKVVWCELDREPVAARAAPRGAAARLAAPVDSPSQPGR